MYLRPLTHSWYQSPEKIQEELNEKREPQRD